MKNNNVWLCNPNPPKGANIRGFVTESRARIDLFAGDKVSMSEELAREVKKTFGFLYIDIHSESDKNKIDQSMLTKDSRTGPIDGLRGLGIASLIKIKKANINTREEFFEKLAVNPEEIEMIVGQSLYNRSFKDMVTKKEGSVEETFVYDRL